MSRISQVHVAPAAPERKAEPGRFAATLRGIAAGATHGVAQTLAVVAPAIPGGAVLAAAIRGGAASAGSARAAGALEGGGGDLIEATRTLQQEAQAFNVKYLQLQESMQRENREFTALSNVMKIRHDTSKAAIANIH